MELIRYKIKDDTVMGVLIDYNWNLGVYYTIEKLGKMIPPGAYWMQLAYSPKFKKDLPLIWSEKVHKNRGIRVHSGNTVKDTNGCILIGNTADLTLLKIANSVPAVAQLVKAMDKSCIYSLFVRNEI
jgi:hypothetical protein